MIFLILAIACSSIISILMRVSSNHIKNKMMMFVTNYLTCLVCSLFFIGKIDYSISNIAFPLWFGILTGVFYLACFLFMEFNIRKNGVVLTSTFNKLGVLVPIFISIVFFKEIPKVLQIIGIALAIIAIAIINIKKGSNTERSAYLIFLVILLLLGGISDATSTIFEHVGDISYKGLYLAFVFLSALICSFILLLIERKSISYKDVLFGIAIGIPNYFSAYFLLNSLQSLQAVVVYPTYSVATIVIISLFGILVFKEKISSKEAIGILLIVASIVLLNI